MHDEKVLDTVFDVNSLSKSELSVPLKIENKDCHLLVDTGCALLLFLSSLCLASTLPSPTVTVKCSFLAKQDLECILTKYDESFEPQLGCFTGEPVVLNESKETKFHKARPVPYDFQKQVKSAILKMEKDGVMERVSSAVSAAPIATVGYNDNDEVCVCGDFSVTHNAFAIC